MTSQRANRRRIFVSYSHKDKRWLELLRVHLSPLEREYGLVTWDDSRIQPGLRWEEEIKSALDSAGVAVLLVSPDFYSSDFIMASELPRLLAAAQDKGTLILPLLLRPSRFLKSKLSQFQAVNDPQRPLAGMTQIERDEVLDHLSNRIEEWLTESQNKPPRIAPTGWEPPQEESPTVTGEPGEKAPPMPDRPPVATLLGATPPISKAPSRVASKSSSRLWVGAAVLAVLLIALAGFLLLWGNPIQQNGPPPVQTAADEITMKLKKGTTGTALGDELIIELKDTQLDQSSNTYKVSAVFTTQGYNRIELPYEPLNGSIYSISGKNSYQIKVLSSDQDSAEFLIKRIAN